MSNERGLAFLIGFDLTSRDDEATKQIEFDRLGILLRPIKDADEEILKKYISPTILYTTPKRIGKYILEDLRGYEHSTPKFHSVLLGLRLLKKGNVYISHEVFEKGISLEHLPYAIFEPYILYADEIQELKLFVEKLHDCRFNDDKINTFCSWFSKTYEEFVGRVTYNTLIDLMICSESLFLDDKYYRYTGSVIGLCCAMLISKNKEERERIKINFEDAYSIRNKEVHGVSLDKLDERIKMRLKNLEKLNDTISDYLRKSIKKLVI